MLKELNSLPDDSSSAQVFKQVGPVLLKQEKGEAAMAVQGRLGYIGSEVYVVFSPLHLFSVCE